MVSPSAVSRSTWIVIDDLAVLSAENAKNETEVMSKVKPRPLELKETGPAARESRPLGQLVTLRYSGAVLAKLPEARNSQDEVAGKLKSW